MQKQHQHSYEYEKITALRHIILTKTDKKRAAPKNELKTSTKAVIRKQANTTLCHIIR